MPQRLQKIIARAGITSRRKAEELIVAGRVTVNGEVVRELGSGADPSDATICVDGKAIQSSDRKRYLALNKPKGCITTTSDPEGRPTVMDLLGAEPSRGLFPVGRLDYNTEGLLLLTNDGDFANHILTAKNKIPKVYEVKLSRKPTKAGLERLRNGFSIDGRRMQPEIVRLLRDSESPWYQVTLVGGRNRQIHRMFERIGILVEKIRRISIGRLTLRGLEPRQVRELKPEEIRSLMNPAPLPEAEDRSEAPPSSRPSRSPSKPTVRGRRGQRKSDTKRRDWQRRRGPSGRDERNGEKSNQREARGKSSRGTGGDAKRKPAPRIKRSARPPRPPRQRQSTASRSPSRAKPTGRGGSPRRSPSPSRGQRNSRPRSRAKP